MLIIYTSFVLLFVMQIDCIGNPPAPPPVHQRAELRAQMKNVDEKSSEMSEEENEVDAVLAFEQIYNPEASIETSKNPPTASPMYPTTEESLIVPEAKIMPTHRPLPESVTIPTAPKLWTTTVTPLQVEVSSTLIHGDFEPNGAFDQERVENTGKQAPSGPQQENDVHIVGVIDDFKVDSHPEPIQPYAPVHETTVRSHETTVRAESTVATTVPTSTLSPITIPYRRLAKDISDVDNQDFTGETSFEKGMQDWSREDLVPVLRTVLRPILVRNRSGSGPNRIEFRPHSYVVYTPRGSLHSLTSPQSTMDQLPFGQSAFDFNRNRRYKRTQ